MMKNKLPRILFCAIIVFSLSITSFPLVKSDRNVIRMNYYFSSPEIVRNGGYDSIEMDGCSLYSFHGIKLPVKPLHILLPYKSDVASIEVRGFGKISMGEGYNIQRTKNILPLYGEGDENKTNSIAGNVPLKMYNMVGVYGLRGYEILVMDLHPVQYDLKTGEIFYYKRIELTINLNEGEASQLYRGLKKDREVVSKVVDNAGLIKSYPTKKASSSIEYVIITNEEFKNMEGEYSLQHLAEFKKSMGINATIVSVEEITSNPLYWGEEEMFNDTQAQIRNFIRYAYLNWETDYVLLAGDGDVGDPEQNIIPPRYLFATTGGLPLGNDEEGFIPSDVYYACLDGTFNFDGDNRWGENASSNNISDVDEADLYAEVWVGRACIDSSQEVENFVMKTISYATSQDDSFFRKILMVGEYIGFGGVADFGSNYKDEIKSLIPEEYEKLTLYDRDWPGFNPNDPWNTGWEKEDIMELLNDGVHIVNHDGHSYYGYNMRMRNSDVDELTNNQYYFLYSQGCMAGGFDNPNGYDCIAEHHTVETPHGAFAVIMNARYGLGMEESTDAPSQRYDISFFKAVFEEGIRELGRANHYSKEDNVWRIDEPGMRWAYYETNLLGDPQLSFKKPEIGISIEKPIEGLYLFDRGPFLSIQKPVIIGSITIIASPSGNVDGVSFYIDGALMYTANEEPYEWKWNSFAIGYHTIKVEAFKEEKSVEQEKEVFIFNL